MNEMYKSYEHYDSRGNLIGNRKWNQMYNRWEYFDNNSSKGRKYEYKSPYNTELMERVLKEKSAQTEQILNQRVAVIQEIMEETIEIAYEKLHEGKISQRGFDKFMKDYSDSPKITNGEVLHDYNNLLDWLYIK